MAYTSGGEIREWDYNILAWGGNTSGTYTASPNNLAYVWGVGTGQKGYGQDVSAFPVVTTGSLVTAASWSGLVYHVNKSLAHQGQTQLANGSNIGIVAGETVTSFANVLTGTTQINTTNLSHFAVGTKTTGSNLDDAISSTTGLSLSTNYDVTVTFASADQARYFFNAGGELQYRVSTVSGGGTGSCGGSVSGGGSGSASSSGSGGSVSSGSGSGSGGGGTGSESSVDRLVTGIGGVDFRTTDNGGRTGSGITLNTNTTSIGYYDLTTSEQTLIKVTDTTAAYTASNANLNTFYQGATDRGAKGNLVRFRVNLFVSDKTWNDTISMTLRHRVDIQYPSTTYLAAVSGTPVVALD